MPRCPICEQPTEIGSKTFPFCGDRCRLIDLGNWLGEKYRVPGEPAPDRPPPPSEDED